MVARPNWRQNRALANEGAAKALKFIRGVKTSERYMGPAGDISRSDKPSLFLGSWRLSLRSWLWGWKSLINLLRDGLAQMETLVKIHWSNRKKCDNNGHYDGNANPYIRDYATLTCDYGTRLSRVSSLPA